MELDLSLFVPFCAQLYSRMRSFFAVPTLLFVFFDRSSVLQFLDEAQRYKTKGKTRKSKHKANLCLLRIKFLKYILLLNFTIVSQHSYSCQKYYHPVVDTQDNRFSWTKKQTADEEMCEMLQKVGQLCGLGKTLGEKYELWCFVLFPDPLLVQSFVRGHCGQTGDCLCHRTGDR